MPKVTKSLLPLNMGCVNGWVVRSEGAVNGAHQCSPVEILAKFSEGIWREAFKCSFPNRKPWLQIPLIVSASPKPSALIFFSFSQDVVFLFFLRRFHSVCWNIPEATQRQGGQGWVPGGDRAAGGRHEGECQNSLHVCKSLSDAEGAQQWLSHVIPYPLACARGNLMRYSETCVAAWQSCFNVVHVFLLLLPMQ